jgi:hypothetical protein
LVEIGFQKEEGIMKQILLASLALLIPAFNSDAYTPPYKGSYVESVEVETYYDGNIIIGDNSIKVTISYEASASNLEKSRYPIAYIKDSFKISHREALKILKRRGHTPRDCKRSYSLHIFVLSHNTMFNSNLFTKYPHKGPPGTAIFGFFDTTPEISGNNNMIIAPFSRHIDFVTIQHEFSHYWHNRYCLSGVFPDPEEFALLMEESAESIFYEKEGVTYYDQF